MLRLSDDLGLVRADPTQIEQVILNLVVNSRDAISQKGQIIIETRGVNIAERQREEDVFVEPGNYVLLLVTDNGCGMDEQTKARIFEPFFTTKEQGRGTGLGLSTVYGIIKQSDGYIFADSQKNHGTTFRIYLPGVVAREEFAAPVISREDQDEVSTTKTILLVDDNVSLRLAIAAFLKGRGLNVFEASNAKEAIEIFGVHGGAIDVLVTDIIMPEINGKELSNHLIQQRPDLATLYISGYSREAILAEDLIGPRTAFIQKPAAMSAIIHEIKKLSD